jgi:predicted PurR-regulated permease PerM
MPKFKKASPAKTETPPTQPFEKTYTFSRGQMMLNNFLGGISWAVGTVIGLAVFLGLMTLVAKNVNLIPYIGGFIGDILNYLQAHGTISAR